MSRVLFLCSGNTCRSPMAAGVAHRVFGPTHTIVSAGAETGSGSQAAGNAIKAMAEMDIDISDHETVDVADLHLAHFDLIVVFRPSAAESLSFPTGVRVEYFEIPDPCGGSLDTYRSTARLIRRRVRRLYVEDALRRSRLADVTGSHASGLFSRAAKEFEKEAKDFATFQLSLAVHDKATLGQLGEAIAEYSASHNRPELTALSAKIAEVNDSWVNVKHRDDPALQDLVNDLVDMQRAFQLLDSCATGKTGNRTA